MRLCKDFIDISLIVDGAEVASIHGMVRRANVGLQSRRCLMIKKWKFAVDVISPSVLKAATFVGIVEEISKQEEAKCQNSA